MLAFKLGPNSTERNNIYTLLVGWGEVNGCSRGPEVGTRARGRHSVAPNCNSHIYIRALIWFVDDIAQIPKSLHCICAATYA
jgi:hypothetical protein